MNRSRSTARLLAAALVAVLLASCTGGTTTLAETRTETTGSTQATTQAEVEQAAPTPTPDDANGDTEQPAATPAPEPTEVVPLGPSGVVFDGSAGAETPADAVVRLVSAINSGDVLGALAFIDPSERDLIANLYVTLIESSEAAWPQFDGHDAISALGLEVVPLSELRTSQYSVDLAWVETDEVEFYMAFPTEVAAAFFYSGEPWGPGSGYRRDEIAVGADDWSEVTYLFGDSSDVIPGLIVTEIDGRWYVSFGRTMLELLRIDGRYETVFPEERRQVEPSAAATPAEAVASFLTALDDDRFDDAASLLVAGEARTFGDYPAILDHWLPAALEIDVALDPESLTIVHQDAGRAVVETTAVQGSVVILDHDEGEFDDGPTFDHTLSLDARCLTVNGESVWCDTDESSLTDFTSLYDELGWDGLRLVTVESDQGWSVSLYESAAHYAIPILSDPLYGLGSSELSPMFGGPVAPTLVNETAKTLPLQTGDVFTLEPFARGRVLIARIESSAGERVLFVDPIHLQGDCYITIWDTAMVTNDWGEEPEHYDDEDCDDHLDRPIEIPAGVELTVTYWTDERQESIEVELR